MTEVAKFGEPPGPRYGADMPVQLIHPNRHGDARGWFMEVYAVPSFSALGIHTQFVQDNHSYSALPFVLRGLHFQAPPHEQEKLVRCVRGRIFDVAVDIRVGSPTFGHWVAAELSAENGSQILVPAGFAHGFLTLEPDCEVIYKVSSTYSPDHDLGVRWDSVGIGWPLPLDIAPELSARDGKLPPLNEIHSPFPYDGRPLEPLS